jgi:uncharacterized coiled-coil DUF342 family protein
MNAVRDERDAFNKKLREHKELRNSYQDQARELIRKKMGTRKEGKEFKSAPLRARELQHQIRDLSYKQETSVLTSKQEEKLIKSIRQMRAELAKLGPEMDKAKKLKVDLSDTDKAIDSLFAQADAEHQQVVGFYKASQEQHDKYVELVKEVGALIADANAKHAHFVELRTKADGEHQKFLELRSKILDIRGADRNERDEARKMIRDHAKRRDGGSRTPPSSRSTRNPRLRPLKKAEKSKSGVSELSAPMRARHGFDPEYDKALIEPQTAQNSPVVAGGPLTCPCPENLSTVSDWG